MRTTHKEITLKLKLRLRLYFFKLNFCAAGTNPFPCPAVRKCLPGTLSDCNQTVSLSRKLGAPFGITGLTIRILVLTKLKKCFIVNLDKLHGGSLKMNVKVKNSLIQQLVFQDSEDLKGYECSIDYIQGTLPFYNVDNFFKQLENIDKDFSIENFELWSSGMYFYATRLVWFGEPLFNICWNPYVDFEDEPVGYKRRLFYHKGIKSSLSIPLYAEPKNENEPNNHGIFIKISGLGLQKINEIPGRLEILLSWLFNNGFTATRIDFALDIFDKENFVVPLVTNAFQNAVVRKPHEETISSCMRRTNDNIKIFKLGDNFRENVRDIYNISFGNHGSSSSMFRIYDKWIELKEDKNRNYEEILKQKCGSDDYWYRLEIECHGEKAARYFKQVMLGELCLYNAWAWAVDEMFRIKVSRTAKTDARGLLPCNVWDEFINLLKEDIHLSKR